MYISAKPILNSIILSQKPKVNKIWKKNDEIFCFFSVEKIFLNFFDFSIAFLPKV